MQDLARPQDPFPRNAGGTGVGSIFFSHRVGMGGWAVHDPALGPRDLDDEGVVVIPVRPEPTFITPHQVEIRLCRFPDHAHQVIYSVPDRRVQPVDRLQDERRAIPQLLVDFLRDQRRPLLA